MARHDGRVVFVRYALPGETVRARVTSERGSYWHAEAVEVARSRPRTGSTRCARSPGADGAGCCDLAFVEPAALRALKGEVVANQLAAARRLSQWHGSDRRAGRRRRGRRAGGPGCGWRSAPTAGPGFHRYHSAELVTDLRCAQLPAGMLDDLTGRRCPGRRSGARRARRRRRAARGVRRPGSGAPGWSRATTRACSGSASACWRLPVTAFWQAHRDAATVYSELVAEWAGPAPAMTAWDLYGGAGRVRRGAGRRRGRERAGAERRHLAGGGARGPGGAGRPAAGRVRHRVGAPGAGVAQLPTAPTSPCSTRRGRGPAARSSTWSPAPVCRG